MGHIWMRWFEWGLLQEKERKKERKRRKERRQGERERKKEGEWDIYIYICVDCDTTLPPKQENRSKLHFQTLPRDETPEGMSEKGLMRRSEDGGGGRVRTHLQQRRHFREVWSFSALHPRLGSKGEHDEQGKGYISILAMIGIQHGAKWSLRYLSNVEVLITMVYDFGKWASSVWNTWAIEVLPTAGSPECTASMLGYDNDNRSICSSFYDLGNTGELTYKQTLRS